jgi:hypothetical protein
VGSRGSRLDSGPNVRILFYMPVETLAEAHACGWRVAARCAFGKHDGMRSIRECLYRAELDLETLLWTRGRAFPLSWLQGRMRCPPCGSREVTITFIVPGERQTARAGA